MTAGEGGGRDLWVEVPAEVAYREVGGECVLLDLRTQSYFTLDTTGTRMWALLAEHHSLREVRGRLLAEFAVDAETLERDLRELVERLAKEGLVSVEERPGRPE